MVNALILAPVPRDRYDREVGELRELVAQLTKEVRTAWAEGADTMALECRLGMEDAFNAAPVEARRAMFVAVLTYAIDCEPLARRFVALLADEDLAGELAVLIASRAGRDL